MPSSALAMGSGIAMDDALVMAVTLEGVLYGFSLLMFIGTIWVLIQKDACYSSNRMVTIMIAVVFLVLSTAHMVVNIVRIDEGFVKYGNTFPGGPTAFFADVSQWSFVTKNAIYTLETLLGDGVVIYRCYVVWQSIWIIIAPCLLWCGVAVTGVGCVYTVSQANVNTMNVFDEGISQWITAFFVLTLSTNLISSGLLAYRIWSIERSVASIRTSKSTLKPVLHALVDAAVLYSATLIVTILCFVNANNGGDVIIELNVPIIAIAFYMVLIRIALGWHNARYTCTVATQVIASRLRSLPLHKSQLSASETWLASQEIERDLQPQMEADNVRYDA